LSVSIRLISYSLSSVKFDQAVLLNSKNDLLNSDHWKIKITSILNQNIDDFSVDTNNPEILTIVETAIHRFIDELEQSLNYSRTRGNFIEKRIKREAYDIAFNASEFRSQVPYWSRSILEEFKDSKSPIKSIAKEKLSEYFVIDGSVRDISSITDKYGCDDRAGCSKVIASYISIQRDIVNQVKIFLGISILLMICLCFWQNNFTNLLLFTIVLIVLLFNGITLPMIDLDARIDNLSFNVIGNNIEFDDQQLIYQSKSILNVIYSLIYSPYLESILVGCLILIFSIGFPVIKLMSVLFALVRNSLAQNRAVKYLLFNSSKWSFADVLIVSIFMSFVAFKSLFKSQLTSINASDEFSGVINTIDHTVLREGFTFFLLFCIANFILSILLSRKLRNTL